MCTVNLLFVFPENLGITQSDLTNSLQSWFHFRLTVLFDSNGFGQGVTAQKYSGELGFFLRPRRKSGPGANPQLPLCMYEPLR